MLEEQFKIIKELLMLDGLTIEQQIEGIDAASDIMQAINEKPIVIEEPEEASEPVIDAPDPSDNSLLDHSEYDGMSEARALELAAEGVKRNQDLVDLGAAGIDALPINGIGKKTAQKWYDRAVELLGA